MAKFIPWLFLAAAIGGAFFIGGVLPLEAVNWRALEVTSLLIGAVGFFPLIGDAQRLVPTNQLEWMKPRTYSWLDTMLFVSQRYVALINGRIAHASAQSPQPAWLPHYQNALPWFEAGLDLAKRDRSQEPVSINDHLDKFPAGVVDPELSLLKDDISKIVKNYGDALKQYGSVKEAASVGAVEEGMVFLSPYIIAVAFGLSLFAALHGP